MTFPHIKELVQNAEDAGARTFKIFYKEGNPETHPRTSGSGYNRYFKVIEGFKCFISDQLYVSPRIFNRVYSFLSSQFDKHT